MKRIGEILGYDAWETSIKRPKGKYIVKVNFVLDNPPEVSVDIEDYEEGKEREYRFVQLKLTGRQNQPFLTFTQPKRLFGELDSKGRPKQNAVWLSIKDEAKKFNIKLPPVIGEVERQFYENYILKQEYADRIISELYEKGIVKSKDVEPKGIKTNNVAFWTILVNDEHLVKKDFYRELLNYKVLEEVVQEGDIVCSICGKKVKRYITDLKRIPLKFFINDKWGYSQGLSDRWEGNFVLCERCYLHLLGGFRYVEDNLSAQIGKIKYMIIPEFIGETDMTVEDLNSLRDYVKNRLNPFHFPEDTGEAKEEMELISTYFNLTYVFYSKNNNRLNVHGVIRDVPKGVVEKVIEKVQKTRNRFREMLSDNNILRGVAEIYWLVPMRERRGDILEVPKIVSVFSAILKGERVYLRPLIQDFVSAARAKYMGSEIFHNVRDGENERGFNSYLLKTNQLLVLLGKKGGVRMQGLPEPYRSYVEEARFNEQETAMFLLGAVMGSIGIKQREKYDYAPILNKINFQGMDVHRLVQLYNEVYEKLHQLKLTWKENEILYSLSKGLFDKNRGEWKLTPQENVYYILSGYAFRKARRMEETGGEG